MTTVLTPGTLSAFLRSTAMEPKHTHSARGGNPRAVALKAAETLKRERQEHRALVARLRRNGWSL